MNADIPAALQAILTFLYLTAQKAHLASVKAAAPIAKNTFINILDLKTEASKGTILAIVKWIDFELVHQEFDETRKADFKALIARFKLVTGLLEATASASQPRSALPSPLHSERSIQNENAIAHLNDVRLSNKPSPCRDIDTFTIADLFPDTAMPTEITKASLPTDLCDVAHHYYASNISWQQQRHRAADGDEVETKADLLKCDKAIVPTDCVDTCYTSFVHKPAVSIDNDKLATPTEAEDNCNCLVAGEVASPEVGTNEGEDRITAENDFDEGNGNYVLDKNNVASSVRRRNLCVLLVAAISCLFAFICGYIALTVHETEPEVKSMAAANLLGLMHITSSLVILGTTFIITQRNWPKHVSRLVMFTCHFSTWMVFIEYTLDIGEPIGLGIASLINHLFQPSVKSVSNAIATVLHSVLFVFPMWCVFQAACTQVVVFTSSVVETIIVVFGSSIDG